MANIDQQARGLAVSARQVANAAQAGLTRLPRPFPYPKAFSDIMPILSSAAYPNFAATGPTKGVGASGVAIAGGGTNFVVGDQITLAGGTAVAPTQLQVTSINAGTGAITGIGVIVRGVYTTAPTNPVSIGSTTSSAGSGATFTMTYGAGSQGTQTNPVGWSPTNAAFRYLGNGPANIEGSGYYGMEFGEGTAMIIEWMYDAPEFDFYILGNNMQYNLQVAVNGQWQQIASSDFTTDASGAPFIHTIIWDNNGTAGTTEANYTPRHYRLFGINMAFGGISGATNGTVWFPDDARRPLAWCMGDSYTFGTYASSLLRTAWNLCAEALGMDWLPDGIGGTGWNSTGTSAVQTRIQQKLYNLTYPPDYVWFNLGYNDNGDDAAQIATLEANFAACVALVQQKFPNAQIICLGPATPEGATVGLNNIRAALITQCTAFNIPFIDVRNWVFAGGGGLQPALGGNSHIYTYSDNTHPNGDTGYGFLGGRYAEVAWSILTDQQQLG